MPPRGFGGVRGSGWLWWRHGQRGDDCPVQAGDTAGIAGKVLLRDGGAVRPILLTAVVLERERNLFYDKQFCYISRLHFSLPVYNTRFIIEFDLSSLENVKKSPNRARSVHFFKHIQHVSRI